MGSQRAREDGVALCRTEPTLQYPVWSLMQVGIYFVSYLHIQVPTWTLRPNLSGTRRELPEAKFPYHTASGSRRY